MTICVAVKVHDCLVFAADSASSIVYNVPGAAPQIARVYEHGNKVFNLLRDAPICAMTSGLGNIGSASISSVAKDFRRLAADSASPWHIDVTNYSMVEVAQKIRSYIFDERITKAGITIAPATSLQFWIGGYGSADQNPEVWQVLIEGNTCGPEALMMDGDTCGWQCGGQPEALNRLILGYSQKLPGLLTAEGVDAAIASKVMAAVGNDPEFQVIEASMPTQDAIALTDFLAETVKGYVRFLPGPDTVGGHTDIAVVTKHEGFKWIKRKHYYPPNLNAETNHV